MLVPGYAITDELFVGRARIICRGVREADGAPVIIKTQADDLAAPVAAALTLRREYQLLRALTVPGIAPGIVPGIARPTELARDDERLALVLEDPGGELLSHIITSGPIDLATFLRISIRIAETVAELHRHNLIHNNIRPNGVLVDAASGRVTLIDLGAASRLSSEQPPAAPMLPECALAYISPEQTGRMNRGVDHRTDLYSVGVTFYEMLTGKVPFESAEPLELIHSHIAKTPAPPHTRNPAVPAPVSDIVMKLLAKMADERYQSALGLARDLELCATEWAARGSIAGFPLGRRDVSDRFVVPQHLYGRERELDTLLRAFDAACGGATAMMLVAGYSGIGKTALIRELYRPLVGHRGHFIAGKFDQIVRTPYGALIQAFRGLVQRLLAQGEAELSRWRARLGRALGTGAAVLAEVIPEIELILGKQPPAPPLAPAEAQTRFRRVFQSFLGVLAGPEHPLVIFLDDLQWADSATLDLLEPLLTSPDIRCLFLIGAYRDNEVDSGHPLARALAALEAERVRLDRIALGPLDLPNLVRLAEDTLHGKPSDVEPLARLLLDKTGGNPFFVIQFLKALRDAELVRFDYAAGRWTFQIEAIAGAGMTDNVIDLMTQKIQRLSPKAQTALTLGACIGNQFDVNTLAIVSQQTHEAAAGDLSEALEEGLLVPGVSGATGAPRYAFLHDRVQQAAYTMIPDEQKHLVHLTVGRLLLERWDPAKAEEKLFDVVHHLNHGCRLITDRAERLALARLNLAAGHKAKASTAYRAALGYLKTGLGLVTGSEWESEYDLMLALHLEAAESEYLSGDEAEAERTVELLLERARTRMDKARVYALRIVRYEYMSRYADAIQAGAAALALFGLAVPESAEGRRRALDEELATIDTLIGGRSIDSLVDLPIMTDPEVKAVMQLLTSLHTPCYLSGDKTLTLLNTTAMVRLSLIHGNVEGSALAYMLHAMHLGPIRGEYRAAYEFGTLALRLNERLPDSGVRAKALMNFAWAVSVWRRPIAESLAYTAEAFSSATRRGSSPTPRTRSSTTATSPCSRAGSSTRFGPSPMPASAISSG